MNYNSINTGVKLARLLKLQNLSNDKLARLLNVSTAYVYKLTKNQFINTEMLLKISEALKVDVCYFFQADENPPNILREPEKIEYQKNDNELITILKQALNDKDLIIKLLRERLLLYDQDANLNK